MAYVDGFLLVVPKSKLRQYKKMASVAGKVWKEHGALDYHECTGDDMKVKFGAPFPKVAKAKPSEMVVFSWITYKSKADRNKINAKVMKDPRIANLCDPQNTPFDMKRMSYGGFKTLVQA